jgi:hypothetical protein
MATGTDAWIKNATMTTRSVSVITNAVRLRHLKIGMPGAADDTIPA